MADRNEDILDALENFFAAYMPEDKVDPKTLRMYVVGLSDLPPADVRVWLMRLMLSTKFMPRISEIRDAVCESLVGLPTVDEAVGMLMQSQSGWVPGATENLTPPLPRIVSEAARLAGGSFRFRSDEGSYAMRDFREIYTRRRAEVMKHVLTGILDVRSAATLASPAKRLVELSDMAPGVAAIEPGWQFEREDHNDDTRIDPTNDDRPESAEGPDGGLSAGREPAGEGGKPERPTRARRQKP